jgi:protein O-mannosyl-transferase
MANRSRQNRAARCSASKKATPTVAGGQRGLISISREWLWGLILILSVILTYTPVWKAGFVWDDETILTANPCIVGPLGLKEIWTTRAADICPLTLTTYWVEHALWGVSALPYHLVNVLLHGACAVLLWEVLRSLRVPGAWLGAALWALHPVTVESVAWITEMKNTESGFYFLLSILFFVRWLRPKEAGNRQTAGSSYYLLSLLFAALAMASKSSTVILPVVICLCAWWLGGRWQWRIVGRVIPMFVMAIASSALSIYTQALHPGIVIEPQWTRTWLQRLCAAGDAIWFYLAKLLWPHPLVAVYPRWQIDAGQWASYLGLLAVIVLLSIFWTNRKRWSRPWFFAFAYFFVALLPILGLVDDPIFRYSLVFDHFQYLGSIGPLALAGAGFARFSESTIPKRKWVGWSLCAGLLLILGMLSWQRSWTFESEERLWTDTLAKNPTCWVAQNNLGLALFRNGRIKEAIAHYQKSLEIYPHNADARDNLGHALEEEGQLDTALAQFQEAAESNPNSAVAHSNLGAALFRKGQVAEAITQYQRALEIMPLFADAHYNLGAALFRKGQVAEAIAQYQKALQINPNYAEAHCDLGAALFREGQVAEAISQYRKALEIKPGYAEAHQNLGVALLETAEAAEAASELQKAVEIKPNYAEGHYNLGVALYQEGRADEAFAEFQRAVEINPRYVDARTNLGSLLLQKGQVDEAIAQLQAAEEINNFDPELHYDLGNALLQKGQLDDAVGQYRKALEIKPNFADAQSNLGLALLQKGQLDEALDQLQKALKINPNSFETRYDLGLALIQKGELEDAIAQFREVLRLKPDFSPAQDDLAKAEALQQKSVGRK